MLSDTGWRAGIGSKSGPDCREIADFDPIILIGWFWLWRAITPIPVSLKQKHFVCVKADRQYGSILLILILLILILWACWMEV